MYKIHSYTGWDFYFKTREEARETFLKWRETCRENYNETTKNKPTEKDKIFYEKMDNYYKELINEKNYVADLNGNIFEKVKTEN